MRYNLAQYFINKLGKTAVRTNTLKKNVFNFYNILFLMLTLFSSLASSEVYQWRDENGKLHFSDKNPETPQSEVKTLDIGIKKFSLPENETKIEPKIWNNEWASRQLVITPSSLNLNGKIGTAWFGPECTSPTAIRWKKNNRSIKKWLPTEPTIRNTLSRTLRSLNYFVDTQNEPFIFSKKIDNKRKVFVTPNIIGLKINFCWKNIETGLQQYDVEDYTNRRLSAADVEVIISWKLHDIQNEVTATIETNGYISSNLTPNSKRPHSIIGAAIEQSMVSLLAHPEMQPFYFTPKPKLPLEYSIFNLQGRILVISIGIIMFLVLLKHFIGWR